MAAETATAVATVIASMVAAGGAFLTARWAQRSTRQEGVATREAVESTVSHAVDLLTVKVEEVQRDVRRLEDWQTSHTAEHILIRRDLGGR